jgi:hypothetical protein
LQNAAQDPVLRRRTGVFPHRTSFAGIVIFGFACFSVFIAATVSGFIVPSTMKHMARDTAANMHLWQVVIDGIFQINQAFAQIYSVAASLAVTLWSVSVLIAVGHLRLNVHGMAAVWFGQAVWFILAGSQLCSLREG